MFLDLKHSFKKEAPETKDDAPSVAVKGTAKPPELFSAGARSCPGFLVGEYIFKAVIADFAQRTLSMVERAEKALESKEEAAPASPKLPSLS